MKTIITGGAGFIGCNAAARELSKGREVVVMDNLSRPGASDNLMWLRTKGLKHFEKIDLRDAERTMAAFERNKDADSVLHLAGQVAVTTSVAKPRFDFEGNALATLNVLEAMRASDMSGPLLFSSTNKVYGGMEDVGIEMQNGRWAYRDLPQGMSEERGLDFHSPYGCSKGAADQYVRDYQRIYGIKTVVFRQSCIYGYRQWGMEDQGWIAWFMIATMLGQGITVYGDGCQVRDVLFIEDLLDAYDAARERIDVAQGNIYNVGGGPSNILSLRDLLAFIEKRAGAPIPHKKADWRPGDQRCYVSDIRKAQAELGWTPRISAEQGMGLLYDWIQNNYSLFETLRWAA